MTLLLAPVAGGTPQLDAIHHCDALTLLRALPDACVDAVITDPPYGKLTHLSWDKIPDLLEMWRELHRVTRPDGAIVMTADQPFSSLLVASNLQRFRHEWIWEKQAGTTYLNANRAPMKNHEAVLVFSSQVLRYFPQMEADLYRIKPLAAM